MKRPSGEKKIDKTSNFFYYTETRNILVMLNGGRNHANR